MKAYSRASCSCCAALPVHADIACGGLCHQRCRATSTRWRSSRRCWPSRRGQTQSGSGGRTPTRSSQTRPTSSRSTGRPTATAAATAGHLRRCCSMSVPSLLGSRLRLLRKAWQLLVVSHVALLPEHAAVPWQHRYEGYDLVVWGQRERIEQGDLEGGCRSRVHHGDRATCCHQM
jgi:hypothetical protein